MQYLIVIFFDMAGLRCLLRSSKNSLLVYCVRCVIVGDRCAVGMITISEILT